MAKVVHFEIPFDNKERAMKFYTESFDWKLDDMPQMNYVTAQSVDVDDRHMPKEAGAINGGLFPRPKEAPNPTIYVDAKSVDGYSATPFSFRMFHTFSGVIGMSM
jgi:uncharacterized protein